MESMKKMRELAPAIAKLKEKHKGDKVKVAQAQAELYKQRGINPGAGCLPYILQIVVLIAFFNVFTTVLAPNGDTTAKLNNLLYSPLKLAAGETLNTHFLFYDLTKPDVVNVGLPVAIPGVLLILGAAIQFLSAKMMAPYVEVEKKVAKKSKGEADDMEVAMQQSMIYTFPLMTLLFGMRFSSGLALYWLMFSVYQAWQQYSTSGWGGLTPWIRRLGLL